MTDGTGGAAGGRGGMSGTGGAAGSAGNRGGAGGAAGAGGSTAGGGTGGGAAGNSGQPDGGAADVSSSMGGSPPSRGPTPPRPGLNFPFPQNRMSANCIYPTGYLNDDVQKAYDQWKAETVTSVGAPQGRRIKRTPTDTGLEMGSTVSEGIGYGMLIAVYMGDQALFDDLWKYEQAWLNKGPGGGPGDGLMDWYINAAGTQVLDAGPASDADEDMAFALVMADKQWGGKGSLASNYIDIAKDQINKIWLHEIFDSKLFRPGDWGDWTTINISYFAPAYYRVFAKVDPGHDWAAVIKTVYDTIALTLNAANKNQTNGLVPAWSTSTGSPNGGAFGPGKTAPTNYQYDSCRTPFRIGLDWCLFGEPRAKDYVAKTSAFFSAVPGGAPSIADGYDLDGTPHAQTGGRSSAFIGPAGVGAMSSGSYQTLVNQAYATVATRTAMTGGNYYDGSWMVISLLMMTGNFLDYTQF